MCETFDKEPAIIKLLADLRLRLGADAFVLADHWEPDRCAVGIATRHNAGVLACLSCFNEPPGRFSYELELPPQCGEDVLYHTAGNGAGVSFEELVAVIADHFRQA